ncbi:MAG: hypothetical protein ACLRVU_07315 [Beduini sp.]|uniref:hypothetical protein n=1 Tax=Beduini sp. TaxID=1922300 RepID=UPI0039A2AD4B
MKQQGFWTKFLITFATSTFLISLIGYIVGDHVRSFSVLFSLGKQGISYLALLEIASLSFLVSLYDLILFQSHQLRQTLFLYKAILMFLLSGFTTAIFIIVFKWFPLSLWLGWVGFLISFLLCFIIAVGVTMYKYKKEERLYNICLKRTQKEKPQ